MPNHSFLFQNIVVLCLLDWGAFTNYVYKRRGVDSEKMLIFANIHMVENVNGGELVVKKRRKLVNVVCEQPLGIGL